MSSPTMIYHAVIGKTIVTVIDVSGVNYLQVYTQGGNERTMFEYEYGETWGTNEGAIKAAERVVQQNK